eukprot:23221-Eustigmatos_ZCMA.PRE.1
MNQVHVRSLRRYVREFVDLYVSMYVLCTCAFQSRDSVNSTDNSKHIGICFGIRKREQSSVFRVKPSCLSFVPRNIGSQVKQDSSSDCDALIDTCPK